MVKKSNKKSKKSKFKRFLIFFIAVIIIPLILFSIFVIIYGLCDDETKHFTLDNNNEEMSLLISFDEKEEILSEFPIYGSRKVEQTYSTLAEWYQVYSYNEFADFLESGGKQSDFPFIKSMMNFWGYYRISLEESGCEDFNWNYNVVSWIIGANFMVEYSLKSFYENTMGRQTEFIVGSDTESDKFISDSWNNYAERMYQYTWYHYPYFDDLKNIWIETPLFNKNFVRNTERKVALSLSYIIKGSIAKFWLLTAAQKENETYSIVIAKNRTLLEIDGVIILKNLSNDKYLIETARYAGFKDIFLVLISNDVRFIEIMNHNVISLSYLSYNDFDPFLNLDYSQIIDSRELFFNPDGYTHRVTLKTKVIYLNDILEIINSKGDKFEMIYDY